MKRQHHWMKDMEAVFQTRVQGASVRYVKLKPILSKNVGLQMGCLGECGRFFWSRTLCVSQPKVTNK